jgi:transcriptional regulator with XRE-family HTH domain
MIDRVGSLLRKWRLARNKTQLDLSFDAGVSQKHISFIEVGRSTPSRQMLLDLAQALDVPLRERNGLLVAAGYAPVYADVAFNEPAMASINAALKRVLYLHEPYPAIVMDRYWNVLLTNDAAPRFFNCFIDMSLRHTKRNILHLMFDPDGMRPFIANWSAVMRALVARVRHEALGRVIDEETRTLLKELSGHSGVEGDLHELEAAATMPMVPISFAKGETTLSYFSMITTVGTPQSIQAEELRIECMYPADPATEANHISFVDEHSLHTGGPRPVRERLATSAETKPHENGGRPTFKLTTNGR